MDIVIDINNSGKVIHYVNELNLPVNIYVRPPRSIVTGDSDSIRLSLSTLGYLESELEKIDIFVNNNS